MEYNKIEWNEGILRNLEIISTPAQEAVAIQMYPW